MLQHRRPVPGGAARRSRRSATGRRSSSSTSTPRRPARRWRWAGISTARSRAVVRHAHARADRRRAHPAERHGVSDRRRHDRPARLDHRHGARAVAGPLPQRACRRGSSRRPAIRAQRRRRRGRRQDRPRQRASRASAIRSRNWSSSQAHLKVRLYERQSRSRQRAAGRRTPAVRAACCRLSYDLAFRPALRGARAPEPPSRRRAPAPAPRPDRLGADRRDPHAARRAVLRDLGRGRAVELPRLEHRAHVLHAEGRERADQGRDVPLGAALSALQAAGRPARRRARHASASTTRRASTRSSASTSSPRGSARCSSRSIS